MARDPESDTAHPADFVRVFDRLVELNVVLPIRTTDEEDALLALPDFPDDEDGRQQFATALRALTGR